MVFAGTTLVWLALDRAPPNWDDAWYLTNSLTVYDALGHGGIAGYITKLNSVFGFKAPLIAALPAPFYLLFGRRWHAAYLVNIAAMALLFFAIYRIARRWWTARAAVLAVAIAGTMPLLYGLARWFLVEYSLTALVALAICALMESALESRGMALLFGVICGLGLLLKISFPVFVLLPFLCWLLGPAYRARALVLAGLACFALAVPWYMGHLRPAVANAIAAGFGESAAVQGTGSIFTLAAIRTYLGRVAEEGVSSYYCWLGLLAAACVVWNGRGRTLLGAIATRPRAVVLLWLLPFTLFLLGENKDVRYIAPILPAFAILLAAALDSAIPRSKTGNVIAALVLVMPFLQMLSVSFGMPFRSPNLPYARRFNRTEWPHGTILKTIAANAAVEPGARKTILVGSDRASFNANNIELAVVAEQLPFEVETTAHEKNLETLLQRLRQSAFFLYKEGGEPESPVFNPYLPQLARAAREDGRFTPLPDQPRLPDGGIARILRNSAGPAPAPLSGVFLPAALDQNEEFAVDLGGTIALTGFSVRRTPDFVVVRWRWRSLARAERDFWCFAHIVDESGRIVSQLDHRILGGEPPLQSWRAGDSAMEEVTLGIPPEVSRAALRLRFGLYDPPTGRRLKFGRLGGLAASRFTAADQSTALMAPI